MQAVTDVRPSGGAALVRSLLAAGVTEMFCVPGESYLPVLDALRDVADRLRLVVCRHEAGAGFMAEANGKLSGRPGVLFVTRGPGACNAALPVHVAQQDSTPMVVFIGQVPLADRGREAFQEIDYAATFAHIAKAVIEVDSAAAVARCTQAALALAQAGRPGPVLVVLPEDVLADDCEHEDFEPPAPGAAAAASGTDTLAEGLAARLAAAERPLLIVGGSHWPDAECRRLAALAGHWQLPVATAFRRQDLIAGGASASAGYLGLNTLPGLWERARSADLVVTIGTRLDQQTSRGYTLFEDATAQQRLWQCSTGEQAPRAGGQWHRLGVAAALDCLERALATAGRSWPAHCAAAHRDYLAWREAMPPASGGVDLALVCRQLDAALPADAVVTIDAGNFTAWPQRYLDFARPRRLLAPINGAMGYGVPAAVGVAAACPQRTVVCFVGDGGMLMTGMELATALQHGLRPIILVVNNNLYGTIRLHQERRYPGRPVASDLRNPDFVAMAKSFGAYGARVTRTAEFAPALAAAMNGRRAALIELVTDDEDLLPGLRLSSLAEGA